jgi:hypothetical protein
MSEIGFMKFVLLLKSPFDPGGVNIIIRDEHVVVFKLCMTNSKMCSPKIDIKSIIFIIKRTIQSSLVDDLLILLLSKGITVHDFYSSELHHDFASIYLNPDRKTLISKKVFSN